MVLRITGTNAALTGGTVAKGVEKFYIQFGIGNDRILVGTGTDGFGDVVTGGRTRPSVASAFGMPVLFGVLSSVPGLISVTSS